MNPGKAIPIAALILVACVGSTNTPELRSDDERHAAAMPKAQPPAQVEPPQVETEAKPTQPQPQPQPQPPRLERRTEHFVVLAPSPIEDALVVPGGVALVQDDKIWLASPNGDEVRMLEDPIDPHGLASDGAWLYWLGNEKNGRIELSTGKNEGIPRFAPSGRQAVLAAGAVLYGVTDEGKVWSVDGMHVSRVDTHADRQWRNIPGGFGAGARVLVLPMLDLARREAFLWRVRVGGKGRRVETKRVQPALWSVHTDGTLVFMRGEHIFRLGAKSNKPRRLFEEPAVSALCWCGDDVCTFVASEAELRIHRKGKTEVRPLAAGLEQPIRTTCSAEYVAWRMTGEGSSTKMGLLAL